MLIFIISSFLCLSSYAHREKWDDNKSEWSELMLAVYNGNNQKVKKLIQDGVAINYKSRTTFTLDAAEVAIRKENELAFNLLISTDSISGLTDYLRLASSRNSSLIVETLILKGADVNDTLDNGYSILMYSASFGSIEVIEVLLKYGANVNQTRKVDGFNALILATFNGEIDKVKLLLEYGADKTYKDKRGRKAYDMVDSIYDRYKVSIKDKEKLKRILK